MFVKDPAIISKCLFVIIILLQNIIMKTPIQVNPSMYVALFYTIHSHFKRTHTM